MNKILLALLTLILPITINAQSADLYSDINDKIMPNVKSLATSIETLRGRIDAMYKSGIAPKDRLEDEVLKEKFSLSKILVLSEKKAKLLAERLQREGKSSWASEVSAIDLELASMQSSLNDLRALLVLDESYRDLFSEYVEAYNKVVTSHNNIQKRKSVLLDIFGWENYGSNNLNGDEVALTSVKIGNLEWADNNLNVKTFRNGDPIPYIESLEAWAKAQDDGKPAWCYYMNTQDNKIGILYNLYAIKDERGLAPVGWRIASPKDWEKLLLELGSEIDNTIEDKRYKRYRLTASGKHTLFSGVFKGVDSGFRNVYFTETNGFGKTKISVIWRTDGYELVRIAEDKKYVTIYTSTDAAQLRGGYPVRCVKN